VALELLRFLLVVTETSQHIPQPVLKQARHYSGLTAKAKAFFFFSPVALFFWRNRGGSGVV
jgi:hypothetical protein